MTETMRPPQTQQRPPSSGARSRTVIALLGVIVLVLAVALIVTVDDDGADVSSDATTTTLAEPTTAPTSAPSTTAPTTTEGPTTTAAAGVVTDAEAATIAWPAPSSGDASDDPVALVTRFAEDVVGFSDPVVGPHQAGDSRSGEVEVRPVEDGPVTTVGVRRMSDDRYYVLFATTSEVELLLPTAGSAIDHPLEVEGWGRGFEGQVRVAVLDRGEGEELGHAYVTAGGHGELAPFTTELSWENPGGGWGVVVAAVLGGDDATTWAATAIPVRFIGVN
ncbi:MAG: Gmad2 immunoglobulin-like domain-containing protein [Acidimicrobiia bacterium]